MTPRLTPARPLASAFAALALAACGASAEAEARCQRACACAGGCSEELLDDCAEALDDARAEAENKGCDEELARLDACVDRGLEHCTVDDEHCEDERHTYGECLLLHSVPFDVCFVFFARRAACPGVVLELDLDHYENGCPPIEAPVLECVLASGVDVCDDDALRAAADACVSF